MRNLGRAVTPFPPIQFLIKVWFTEYKIHLQVNIFILHQDVIGPWVNNKC